MKRRYWFKRKRYGYGYVPVTWEGWLTLAVVIVAAIIPPLVIGISEDPPFWYFGYISTLIFSLIAFSVKKGPKMEWRWGKGDSWDPEEDL